MYSSGYSQVSKNSPQAQKRMKYRSKGKSCGYYMRIVFFFSSLIQSLIIASLVLFLVYGKQQDSASTERVQDLEESFSRLSIETVTLRQQRKNLTNLLNVTLTRKARNDWDLAKLRQYANTSVLIIHEMEKQLHQCNTNLIMCNAAARFPCDSTSRLSAVENCNCGLMVERLKARLEFVDSNFTQTAQRMRMEMDQIAKERDFINLEAIRLRREKSTLEKELHFSKEKCKNDFSQSLSGVTNVSKAFLLKIDSIFPAHLPFQLTCQKQREHLEQIRTNCTSLSREVEDKLQRYLNSVGDQVSDTYSENSRLKAENMRLYEDYRQCNQNRTGLIREHKQNFEKLQQRYDQDKERLLMDKITLNGQIDVLEHSVKYKSKVVEQLTQQIGHLNISCMSKIGIGGYGGANSRTNTLSQSGWSSAGGSQLGRAGSGGLGSNLGSTGLGFNKLGSTGTGSSSSSPLSPRLNLNLGSSGLGLNKLGSTGTGSSSPSLLSPGSTSGLGSTGSALNKLGSTGTGSSSSPYQSPGSSSGLGSTGLGLNKLGSTGTGSSSSSVVSPGSNSGLGSTGLGLNKLGSTGTGSSSSSVLSPGSNLGLGSTGSGLNKLGSTGAASSSLGSDSSSSSLSIGGTGANKPVTNVRGSSTAGSSSGQGGSSPNLSSSGTVLNKPTASKTGSTSSGFSWLMFGNSQSKAGSGTAKGTSTNSQSNSHGGSGSVVGAGRMNGLGGGSVNVAQHIKDLQRLINPPGPEEKQDLSRMLG